MADVTKIDIDGIQWDIKDQIARDKINLLGDDLKIKAISESYKNPKNNIFRGKCLNGSTSNQYPILPFNNLQKLNGGGYSITEIIEKIANGNFDDIYIGDYIIDENNKIYRIAGLDTELNKGDNNLSSHHAVIIPDFSFTNMAWNTVRTTVGGYQKSEVQTYCDVSVQPIIESIFGVNHVLTVRDLLSSALNESVTSPGYSGYTGATSAWEWSSHKVRLMSEVEVYGAKVWSGGHDIGNACEQFPLFRLMPQFAVGMKYSYWLSGIANSAMACVVWRFGAADRTNVDGLRGVRPRFLIG